jgi:hypothetical protein
VQFDQIFGLTLRAYRSPTAATNSFRVAMLIRLIPVPAAKCSPGANQVRQRHDTQEHFRRGNAEFAAIRMRNCDRGGVMMSVVIVAGKG